MQGRTTYSGNPARGISNHMRFPRGTVAPSPRSVTVEPIRLEQILNDYHRPNGGAFYKLPNV